ncbi:hypothetical protein [Spirillospora sp. CA-294931]|uniref:hypothetical protein n=1 Tax=Spirillospora sp. CA-294931 TaxID=3240042 RepID=UPI003D8B7A39
MELRVDMIGLRFLVAEQPKQRKDFDSGNLRTSEDGRPLMQVQLLVMDGERAAPIKVGVVGDPGLGQGVFVHPVNLVLNVMDRKGDTIMWWTADGLPVASAVGAPALDGAKSAQQKGPGK